MLTHRTLKYISVIALATFSTVSFAAFRKSIIQKEDNNFYIALGGGGGVQGTSDWDLVEGAELFSTTPITAIFQPTDDYVGVANGMGALGYGFSNVPIRIEVAYNYIGNGEYEWDSFVPDLPSGQNVSAESKIQTNAVTANFYLDFNVTDVWAPYIMGGAGYGLNSAKFSYDYVNDSMSGLSSFSTSSDSETKGNFIWNAGVGINYAASKEFTLGLQVAYFHLGKVEVNAEPSPDLDLNEISLMEIDNLYAVIATANVAYHF